jgi:hypothetical protein
VEELFEGLPMGFATGDPTLNMHRYKEEKMYGGCITLAIQRLP